MKSKLSLFLVLLSVGVSMMSGAGFCSGDDDVISFCSRDDYKCIEAAFATEDEYDIDSFVEPKDQASALGNMPVY
ncbi:hypothetical protein FACS1894152_0920 [Bacilli bacterium]|nr:hypothetical protein FACS1894152_0920 [Bacilli bacterium]